jgi:hypothetical protein
MRMTVMRMTVMRVAVTVSNKMGSEEKRGKK